MDKVKAIFDKWEKTGRAELMEKEHQKSVLKFFDTVSFEKPFSFLDIGCGNGWVVRRIAGISTCKKAVGIDKSKNMIKRANKEKVSSKEQYYQADIESWKHNGKFDYVFSMETLYYVNSVDLALQKICNLLKQDGLFFCGTDFYKENKATVHWSKMLGLDLHLLSTKQWKKKFSDACFKPKIMHVKDPKNTKKWKRELGTLFIIGQKV